MRRACACVRACALFLFLAHPCAFQLYIYLIIQSLLILFLFLSSFIGFFPSSLLIKLSLTSFVSLHSLLCADVRSAYSHMYPNHYHHQTSQHNHLLLTSFIYRAFYGSKLTTEHGKCCQNDLRSIQMPCPGGQRSQKVEFQKSELSNFDCGFGLIAKTYDS